MNTIIMRIMCVCLVAVFTTPLTPLKAEERMADDNNMDEVSVDELQRRMAAGEMSAVSITRFYLNRIETMNLAGPSLHAVIAVNPDAVEAARALDEERRAGSLRGPLHGIPVILKDNIDTVDKMPTTAGALALASHFASDDAFIVKQLRKAGAIILAKANLSEWANFRSEHSVSGWSTLGGQTRNPYVLNRNTCGSSSGSAVSVSANFAPLAVGTETDGSIVCPSAVNGIVGIKPTVGLLSRSGIIPIAHSQDTAGPMARTVRDAATMLGAMVGVDNRDEDTLASAEQSLSDYTSALDVEALKGARIGVAGNLGHFSQKANPVFARALDTLRAAGAEVIEVGEMPHIDDYGDQEYEVLLYEFKTELNAYLADVDENLPVHSLSELIAFNLQNAKQTMPHFAQEILYLAQEKGPLSDKAYLEARETSRKLARAGIDTLIEQHNLDAIVTTIAQPAWPTDHLNGDHYLGGSSSPAAVSGYPSVAVPMGNVRGLPLGMAFIGARWQEAKLIGLAYSFEQRSQSRIAPKYLAELPLTP